MNPQHRSKIRGGLYGLYGLALFYLLVGSSCQSGRYFPRSKKSAIEEPGAGENTANQSTRRQESREVDSVALKSQTPDLTVPPSMPGTAALRKDWFKILGHQDFRQGDLKMEGNWNITYNETQIASPVIMLVRPQRFIYISIRPALGIEMMRIVLQPDSVWMISRLNKNYWCGTWTELEPSLGMSLDYRWFQDALLHTHQSFIDQAVDNGLTPPTTYDQPFRYIDHTEHSAPVIEARLGRWPSKIHQLHLQSPKGSLQIKYLQIHETESASLPTHMTFELQIPRNKASLEMHWKEPKPQLVERPSLKIPDDYQKLKLAK